MTVNLVVNGVVGVLLILTLGFCFVLNRRISMLRRSSAEMAALMSEFDVSIEKARDSVKALKDAANESGTELQGVLDAAIAMRDELVFLTGTKFVASCGPQNFSGFENENDGSDEVKNHSPVQGSEEPAPPSERSEAERELVQALRQVR